jgi:hypothetical protein
LGVINKTQAKNNEIKWGLPNLFYTNFKRNKYFFDILPPGAKGYIGEFLSIVI